MIRRTNAQDVTASEIKTHCGRWQSVNECHLPDGGSVTVGSDITAFKTDECRLQGEQARLREKVAMLAAARRRLELKCDALNRALGLPSSGHNEAARIASDDNTGKGQVIRKTIA